MAEYSETDWPWAESGMQGPDSVFEVCFMSFVQLILSVGPFPLWPPLLSPQGAGAGGGRRTQKIPFSLCYLPKLLYADGQYNQKNSESL